MDERQDKPSPATTSSTDTNSPRGQELRHQGSRLLQLLHTLFDLRNEKEDEIETIESLRQDVEFKGTKMWILIFAILIASLGLNTNSTAVIIGAMLISPLMGPIIGLGLGLGITDFNLVRRSAKHFAFATIASVITSTLFFFLSPIDIAQSELLSRTQPTIYDVFIALAGGFAGIIAGASKSKGNVIPGVAIATALMPPLCTAGYGLGTGQMSFFFGAFYLYIINTVFIALATFITVRLLNYPRMTYMDPKRGRRLNHMVTALVVCVTIPSILLASQMISRTITEERQKEFIANEVKFEHNYLLDFESIHRNDSSFLVLSMLGDEIPPEKIEVLQARLAQYKLPNTYLIVNQSYGRTDLNKIKSSIISDIDRTYYSTEEVFRLQSVRIDSLQHIIEAREAQQRDYIAFSKELHSLFPEVTHIEYTSGVSLMLSDSIATDSTQQIINKVNVISTSQLSTQKQEAITKWIDVRMPESTVTFVLRK